MNTAKSAEVATSARRRSSSLVTAAVRQNSKYSLAGLNERAFAFLFSGLVYPQIWEDPVIDLEALAIERHHRIITIASGGCNALSYLVDDPAEIIAVDLNASHAALNRLKIAAARHLPDYASFYAFVGAADRESNVELFDRYIAGELDAATLAFWNARGPNGRRRIERFARGFYRYGLLGRFIALGHTAARLYGRNPRQMLEAGDLEQQREIYERVLKPLFQKRLIRAVLNQRWSLFGLGIPPAQYDALSGGRPMHEVVEERLARLACGSALEDNYFAWQAFNRGYAPDGAGPLPPYLQKGSYEAIRDRASRIAIRNTSFTEELRGLPAQHLDRFVLLDAQDWMMDDSLTELWAEITRTARPGARVIFRTAGEETILPGRLPESLLTRWRYEAAQSKAWSERDRSAIYGGFHLYVLREAS